MSYPLLPTCPPEYLDCIGFFNGEFKPLKDISISPFDRGYLFGDSVYEVILVLSGGNTVDLDHHLARLQDSLSLSKMALFTSNQVLEKLKQNITQVVDKNLNYYGNDRFGIYLQVGRNQVGPRNHVIQDKQDMSILINPIPVVQPPKNPDEVSTKKLACHPEIRWGMPKIKTTMLMPNILAKKNVAEKGYDDALFVSQDQEKYLVRESTASNILILNKNEEWITPMADGKILNGITRQRIIQLYKEKGITITERDVKVEELKNSLGACLSSSTITFQPILQIDEQLLNNGVTHPKVLELIKTYRNFLTNLEKK